MFLVDHLFIILLFVVQPIYGAISFRRFIARIEAGETADRGLMYRQIIRLEWAALAVLAAAWLALGRPLADLGLRAPSGWGFWLGAGLLLVAGAFLLSMWRSAARSSREERAGHRADFGSLVHFLPQTRPDLRLFMPLSVTAGVVEEIVYRGFVLWYLTQLMPLWSAVLVSAVAFGLGHSYQGAAGALRTGVIGLVFGIYYVLTGSIWLPIIAHAILDILQGAMIFELLRDRGETQAIPQSS